MTTTTVEKKTIAEHNIQLTAAELGFLWSQYMNDSLAVCVLSYFQNKCEDEQVLPVIESSLQLSKQNIQTISKIYNRENHPIPVGFTEDDVNVNAPKLFSDTYMLMYVMNMTSISLLGNSVALGLSSRSDVVDFVHELMASASELHIWAKRIALEKGVYIRPPYISVPEKVDFVKKQSFLFDVFSKHKRPVNAIEISHLYLNIQTNSLGKTLIMGFAQVCKSEDVKKYFIEGKRIATEHIHKFSELLTHDDLPTPMGWDAHVLDSTTAPFSDKLMMYHITEMIAIGIGNYGASIGASQRADLGVLYARLTTEIALYAEDGANVLINHGWLEEPPQANDRQALINEPK